MTLTVTPVQGLPELAAGSDLAGLLLAADPGLSDGAVLTVSSKAVAKVEGRTVTGHREALVDVETDRDVARRGPLRVARTRHGLVLAAAGVDVSNTPAGTVVPLPLDPDGSARRLRTQLNERAGRNVAVLVTDTAGRAWRLGQTDIAVGCAGLEPLHDLAGHPDAYGRPLAVTAPAVADELAAAAELVLAKAAGTPAAVLTGLAALVLPPGRHGPGAAALVRPESDDMFGLGSADAVSAAVRRDPADARGFPSAPATDPVTRLAGLADRASAGQALVRVAVTGSAVRAGVVEVVVRPAANRAATDPEVLLAAGAVVERLRVLAWADGARLDAVAVPDGAVDAVGALATGAAPYTGRRPATPPD